MSEPAKVALFADHKNEQLARLSDAIKREGGAALRFDIQLGGPRKSRVTIGKDVLRWDDTDFRDIRAAHIRCTAPNCLPMPPALLNAVTSAERRVQFLREQQYQAASHAFFEALSARGALVVNRLVGYVDHDTKGQLSEKLLAQGFDMPVTLTTNDPIRTREFLARYGEVIVKPQIGIGSARLITEADQARLDELACCPVLMQERVRGDTVRVHIVGDTVVLALRILTMEDQVDSRTQTRGFEYYEMTEQEQRRIVAATRFLGLYYAAWDVIVTAEGRCVYLDCNPGPYIMWIGPKHVKTVLTALARYLLAYCRTGSVEAASAVVEPWRPRKRRALSRLG